MRQLSAILALWAGITACVQAAEPITLGLNYPRTGPYKEEGLAQMRGALLAIDEINAQGGVLGRPLRLSSKDTASRPAKAERNVDKLAAEGAAVVAIGGTVGAAVGVAYAHLMIFGLTHWWVGAVGTSSTSMLSHIAAAAWPRARRWVCACA